MNQARFEFLKMADAQLKVSQQEDEFREEVLEHNKVFEQIKVSTGYRCKQQ